MDSYDIMNKNFQEIKTILGSPNLNTDFLFVYVYRDEFYRFTFYINHRRL